MRTREKTPGTTPKVMEFANKGEHKITTANSKKTGKWGSCVDKYVRGTFKAVNK